MLFWFEGIKGLRELDAGGNLNEQTAADILFWFGLFTDSTRDLGIAAAGNPLCGHVPFPLAEDSRSRTDVFYCNGCFNDMRLVFI